MQRVLLVSDSAVHAAVAEAVLRDEGLLFRHESSLPAGLSLAREWRPLVLILDLAVPLERDGVHAAPVAAGRSAARGALRTRLTAGGLEAVLRDPAIGGATGVLAIAEPEQLGVLRPETEIDDFLLSPLDEEELRLRVRRALARAGGNGGSVLRRGGVVLDLERYTVTVDGAVVDLTYKEYELLAFLAGSPGRAFTREALLDRVWGYDYYGGARTVDVHVRRIRSKIEGRRQYIETVRNVGYRFVEL
ncbi:MAG: winged-helix domain-containing protein [Chloroflexi bacterium]|nr:winged-helix domain-containing protein [Chloroflexota bacterium]